MQSLDIKRNKINYYLNFKKEIDKITNLNAKPNLLLHVCCAPCSSGCIEMLTKYFNVTALFYNPNISPLIEYEKRKDEFKRFVKENEHLLNVKMVDCDYDNRYYNKMVAGLEKEHEGGARCKKCFALRLDKTAQLAKSLNFDYFCTTLTISPLKDACLLNEIGIEMQNKYNIKFLQSDFKKQDGYKKSIENSKKFNLYRQDYCGCIYSKIEREKIKEQKI